MKTLEKVNAISLLKEDHKKVKALFDRFEKTNNRAEKKKIVAEALQELKVHATVEEELFYPALRNELEDKEGEALMEEADEEHHVAKVLIAELDQMNGDEEHYDAKFIVLAENIRHHIKEEEGEMFPEAKKTDIDMSALGAMLAEKKEELIANGVPPDAEAKMVEKVGLRGDSPAKNAQKTFQAPQKSK